MSDTIDKAWRMHTIDEAYQRRLKSRLQVINEVSLQAGACGGQWLTCALNVLDRNSIHHIVFADALRTRFTVGRGKHINILVTGPADCAKTFLFKPLEQIFPEAFLAPSSSQFSWIGVEHAPVIWLND